MVTFLIVIRKYIVTTGFMLNLNFLKKYSLMIAFDY